MGFLISIPGIFWLLTSAIFFAVGELFSKTWANSPSLIEVILLLLAYSASSLLWLPALFQKNQLASTGVAWLILGTLATTLLGILLFHEKINLLHGIGIFLALIAMVLLNI